MFRLVGWLFMALFLATGCGHDESSEPSPQQMGDPEWDAIKPIVKESCVKCHNGVKQPLDLSKKSSFKTPKVKAAIESGRMPPSPATLPVEYKTKLLAYLEGS